MTGTPDGERPSADATEELAALRALLAEAAAELEAEADARHPAADRDVYPSVARAWARDMDLPRRIAAALARGAAGVPAPAPDSPTEVVRTP